MRPMESFIGQPIRSLQTMLRVIAENTPGMDSLIPDGIYGRQTMQEVSRFQQQAGIPVTGVTDQRTWDAIAAAYDEAIIFVDAAEPIEVILNPNQVIRAGEEHPVLFLAQGMLQILSDAYDSVGAPSHTGRLDPPTADSLGTFQALSGLNASGELDRKTWKHLVRHYPLAANLLVPSLNPD